ncbi:MAG: biotin/lipoyl-binding protein [Clostridia bacterium]|nr:biotin/lipoyl-binding protein [Clostridia bacterium]
METYSVTVNGVTYDVQVEKKSNNSAANVAPTVNHTSLPVPAPKSEAVASEPSGIKITAGAAGKIWKIVAKEGQTIKLGTPVVILEAMKMEIPVVAPQDGVISQVFVSEGDPVEAGDLLATMN